MAKHIFSKVLSPMNCVGENRKKNLCHQWLQKKMFPSFLVHMFLPLSSQYSTYCFNFDYETEFSYFKYLIRWFVVIAGSLVAKILWASEDTAVFNKEIRRGEQENPLLKAKKARVGIRKETRDKTRK